MGHCNLQTGVDVIALKIAPIILNWEFITIYTYENYIGIYISSLKLK